MMDEVKKLVGWSISHFDIVELIDNVKYLDPKTMSFFKVKRHMEDGKESFTSIPYTLQDVYDIHDANRTPAEKAGYVCTLQEYREARLKDSQKDLDEVNKELYKFENKMRGRRLYLQSIITEDKVKINRIKLYEEGIKLYNSLDMY
jgi:hypothetical protein